MLGQGDLLVGCRYHSLTLIYVFVYVGGNTPPSAIKVQTSSVRATFSSMTTKPRSVYYFCSALLLHHQLSVGLLYCPKFPLSHLCLSMDSVIVLVRLCYKFGIIQSCHVS